MTDFLKSALMLFSVLFSQGVFAINPHLSRWSLLKIYHAALVNDPQLASARARYRSEQERVPQARAKLLPSLALTSTGSRTHERITGIPGLSSGLYERYNDWKYGLHVSQPLLKPTSWYKLDEAH